MRLISVIQLSRPLNLLVVGATMYITRYIVLSEVLSKGGAGELKLSSIHFSALVLSALLVTAGGNVINDYFDQRVDKINKPDRIIVGKKINRKHAILIHQGLNILSFSLVFWVAMSNHYWMVLLFPLATTFMLWWYSPVFKKKPLIGNVIVALCTALVPIFAAICDLQIMQSQLTLLSYSAATLYNYAWLWILGIASFAFVLTMIREVVKDAQDEPGDRSEHYQTLPILWGTKRTKRYIIGWMVVFFIMVGACAYRIASMTDMLWLIGCLVAPMLVALYRVSMAVSPADFGRISRWIKITMLGGLLLMVAVLV